MIVVNGSRWVAGLAGGEGALDSAEATVRVTLLPAPAGTAPDAQLHSVAVAPLASDKINPGARLRLEGVFSEGARLPCLTSQGEGVARSRRVKAHDVRSFHPGQVRLST